MRGKRNAFWLIPPLVLAADRVTKLLSQHLPEEGQVLLPGVVRLRPVMNRGMAFSLLSGQPVLLGLLSLAVILGAFFALRGKKLSPLTMTGLMLMLGGAAGNMLDRFFQGGVPDMIELLFVRFAVFNVADICLTVGCALVMLSLLLPEKGDKKDG